MSNPLNEPLARGLYVAYKENFVAGPALVWDQLASALKQGWLFMADFARTIVSDDGDSLPRRLYGFHTALFAREPVPEWKHLPQTAQQGWRFIADSARAIIAQQPHA